MISLLLLLLTLILLPEGCFSFHQRTRLLRRQHHSNGNHQQLRVRRYYPTLIVPSLSSSASSFTGTEQKPQWQNGFENPAILFKETTGSKLPILDIMDDILQCLSSSSSSATSMNLILEAPPGAGKTTIVPLACYGSMMMKNLSLANEKEEEAGNLPSTPGAIIVVEPRRVAVRSAATRMANLVGESVSQTVGYTIRGESRVSTKSKIIVMTDGVLLNKIQQDPELSGVSTILFDEFHERGIGSDTSLALSREIQNLIRPDLRLIVMSATLLGEYKDDKNEDADNGADETSTANKLVRALGGSDQCQILRSDGRQYPIDIKWPKQIDWKSSGTRLQPLGVLLKDRNALVETMCGAIEQAVTMAPSKGDVLVFLPGVAEIKRVIQSLQERRNNIINDVEVVPLYGALPKDEQDYALFPNGNSPQRVIVSTPIAEASLTLERVTCVVDSGLRREPRCDADTAMPRLITTRCSKASATQRAGRAGRIQPGICLRIFTESDYESDFLEHSPAEIASADLASTALLLTDWGCTSEQEILEELPFVDAPNPSLLQKAIQLLVYLKAVELRDDDETRFAINPIGKQIVKIPTHPRLATALVRASDDQILLAGAVAATFIMDDELGMRNQRDPDMGSMIDIIFSKQNARPLLRFAQRISSDAQEAVQAVLDGTIASEEVRQALGRAVLPGFIDLVANRKGDASYGGSSYLLSLGRSARLDGIRDMSLQYVIVLDTSTGDDGITRIRSYASIDKQELLDVAEEREMIFTVPSRGHEVRAKKVIQVGRLELDSSPLPAPSAEQVAKALKDAISNLGGVGPALVKTLPGDKRVLVDELCSRVRLAKKLSAVEDSSELWPEWFAALDSSKNGTPNEAETMILDQMIDPWLSGVKSLKQVNMYDILKGSLTTDQQHQLDRDFPTRIDAPDGSKVPIQYSSTSSDDSPTASAKLQQFFGTADSPKVGPQKNQIPISLSLLSPAGKSLALTSDLPFFWKEVYPSIRAEMRGRYAKHPWPEDPMTATATRQTKKQEAKMLDCNVGGGTNTGNNNKSKRKNKRKRK